MGLNGGPVRQTRGSTKTGVLFLRNDDFSARPISSLTGFIIFSIIRIPIMKDKPTYLLGDHHANYDDLLRAVMRKGLKNAL
jgi:hypothetical protein